MLFFSKKEPKELLTAYEAKVKFQKLLTAIGRMPLSDDITIEEIGATKEDIQAAYREIKKRDLKIGIVDFFCWVSTQIIATQISLNTEISSNIFAEVERDLGKSMRMNGRITPELANAINTLRLFHSHPDYFLDAISGLKPEDRRDMFILISGYWYDNAYRRN